MSENEEPSPPPGKPKKTEEQIARERELRKQRAAKQAEEEREWDAKSEVSRKASDEFRRKWSLSLTVGNGAALVGLSSVLLSADRRPPDWVLLLPAAWAFVVGLISAGLLPMVRALLFHEESQWAWVVARERSSGGPTMIQTGEDDYEDSDAMRSSHWAKRRRWDQTTYWLEGVAAVAFLLGLLWPLITMSADAFGLEFAVRLVLPLR